MSSKKSESDYCELEIVNVTNMVNDKTENKIFNDEPAKLSKNSKVGSVENEYVIL